MNKTAEKIDDDEDEQELETLEVKDEEVEAASDAEDISEDDDDEGDALFVTIKGVSPTPEDEDEERAPVWVRDLRKSYREEKRRAKELEQKLASLQKQEERVAPLGPKPTLEASDYHTERFESALAQWYEQKREHDQQKAAVQAQQQEVQRNWDQRVETYHEAKKTLKVRDFDFAEDVVVDTLSVVQQGMIVQGADNPALLIYALGKNPKKMQELASITDPVKFAFAVSKLEERVDAQNRKATSKPEKKITGSGRISGSIDNTLERLRSDAEKTGDYSKVFAYKRKNK
jgi:hypothetical protein